MKVQNNSRVLPFLQAKIALLKEALRENTYLEVFVSGDSMEPTLIHGDCVVISGAIESIQPGDIVLCHDAEYIFVLHRVIEMCPHQLILKGDNADNYDLIPQEWVIGKMVCQSEEFTLTRYKNSFRRECWVDGYCVLIFVDQGRLTKYVVEKKE